MSDYADFLEKPELYASPILCQQRAIDLLEKAGNRELLLVDTTNPLVALLGASANQAAGCAIQADALVRRVYPRLSKTQEDLYAHMSDEDYVGRFATPDQATLQVTLSVDQIIQSAVIDSITGLPTLIIPADTRWTGSGYDFYQHHPVVIQLVEGGGLLVKLDTATHSTVLSKPASNLIRTERQRIDGLDKIRLYIPVEQLRMESASQPISSSSGLNKVITHVDNFYYLRAWTTTNGNNWTEIHVTHDEQVYDPFQPTVIVTVLEGMIRVKLPEVYLTNGTSGSQIRLDLYTTKGETGFDLSTLASNDWGAVFADPNNRYGTFSGPLSAVTDLTINSVSLLQGGRAPLSFELLREKTTYGLKGKQTSVTDKELVTQLRVAGYNVSLIKNTVAGRVYLASRTLPSDATLNVSAGIGVNCTPIIVDADRLDLPSSMIVNSDRTTIKPTALFESTSAGINILSDASADDIRGLDRIALVDRVNQSELYYTPFHYVLDASQSVFNARAYILDSPSHTSHSYEQNNTQIGYVVSTSTVSIALADTDYVVTVIADVPNGLAGLDLQVVYVNGTERLSTLATRGAVANGQATFTFRLETTLDLDSEHKLTLNNLVDGASTIKDAITTLDTQLEFLYVAESLTQQVTAFDNKIAFGVLPGVYSGVAYEVAKVTLGTPMSGLFARARSLPHPPVYERYAADVVDTYRVTEYETRSDGSIIFDLVGGKPTARILNAKGDPKLNNGEPVVLHAKGDIRYNEDSGLPVILEARKYTREARFVLLDAKFLFGDTPDVIRYRNTIPRSIERYLEGDIADLRSRLIERTELYFEPTSTTQTATAKVDAGREIRVNTALRFDVTVYMSKAGVLDNALRVQVAASVRDIIRSVVQGTQVSLNDIRGKLVGLRTNDILDIIVADTLPGSGFVTITDDGSEFAVRSRVLPLTNAKLDIEDDINFTYLEY